MGLKLLILAVRVYHTGKSAGRRLERNGTVASQAFELEARGAR